MRLTPAQKTRILQTYVKSSNTTIQQLADEYGVSLDTIYQIVKGSRNRQARDEEIVALYDEGDTTFAEIGQKFGLSDKQVGDIYHKARPNNNAHKNTDTLEDQEAQKEPLLFSDLTTDITTNTALYQNGHYSDEYGYTKRKSRVHSTRAGHLPLTRNIGFRDRGRKTTFEGGRAGEKQLILPPAFQASPSHSHSHGNQADAFMDAMWERHAEREARGITYMTTTTTTTTTTRTEYMTPSEERLIENTMRKYGVTREEAILWLKRDPKTRSPFPMPTSNARVGKRA